MSDDDETLRAIDALLAESRRACERHDLEYGERHISLYTRRGGTRPYEEVLLRLATGEAGLSEDLTDREIADAHDRESRELVAWAIRRPLPCVPAWAETDPRLDNVQRHTLAGLLEAVDARDVVLLDLASLAARIHCPAELIERAIEGLRVVGYVARVGTARLRIRRPA